jgi:hypothetical protein
MFDELIILFIDEFDKNNYIDRLVILQQVLSLLMKVSLTSLFQILTFYY